MKFNKLLSQEDVKSLFSYEESSGALRWKNAPKKPSKDGLAGSVTTRGYRIVTVHQVPYLAHRLIWLYMTGKWPDQCVDHINGNPIDNRWFNLREASVSQNSCNRRVKSSAKSRVKGVSWCKQTRKWKACVVRDGKEWTLGRYKTIEEAANVYRTATAEIHGEFARFV